MYSSFKIYKKNGYCQKEKKDYPLELHGFVDGDTLQVDKIKDSVQINVQPSVFYKVFTEKLEGKDVEPDHLQRLLYSSKKGAEAYRNKSAKKLPLKINLSGLF